MTDTLMVGVSGIRGIVGKDLTEDVVARYAAAFGQWAKAHQPLVVVGRDARQSGPAFEQAVTGGLAAAGCAVVTLGVTPTPTIQLAVEYHRAGGGIAITASHNPIEWNALKFIGPDGIFLDGADGKRVLELAGEDGGARGRLGEVKTDGGAIERHLDAVLKLPAVDVEGIRKRGFHVALYAVRGAGGPVMRTLLERLGCRVTGIHLETDGRFPHAPEPVPENLGELAGLVRRSGADVGIAVDPDVDRLAIVDETGAPIGEDYTLAFAIRAVLGG
ncbi:MAG: phosphoglucosamine mutase, partial [Gemmatimonadetes bacterium]